MSTPANVNLVNPHEVQAAEHEGEMDDPQRTPNESLPSQSPGPRITPAREAKFDAYISSVAEDAESEAKRNWVRMMRGLERSFAAPGGASRFQKFREDVETMETQLSKRPDSHDGSLDPDAVVVLRSIISLIDANESEETSSIDLSAPGSLFSSICTPCTIL
jgi:hypothetical protein